MFNENVVRSLQLDSCARLHVGVGRRVGSYLALGTVGGLAGAAVATIIAVAGGHSAALAAIVTASTLGSFLAAVKATQIFLGYERIVLYELFLLALVTTGVVLVSIGQPLRAGLDVATIGIGTMLVFGRIGCLRVGCCHGRPAEWGIVYGDDHALAGFLPCYVGVRLFAVQLIEAMITAAIVAVCIGAYLRYPAGQALCLYASLYGVARFGLERLRGDVERPYVLGISEAQWLAFVTCWAATWAGHEWALPLVWCHTVAAAALTVATVASIVADRMFGHRGWWFRDARRTRELAEALQALVATAGDSVALVETPSGLRLSCSRERDDLLLGLSCPRHPLSPATARTLARDARHLLGPQLSGPERGQTPGFFHLRSPFNTNPP